MIRRSLVMVSTNRHQPKPTSHPQGLPLRPRSVDVVDLFAYIVVLGLFVQFLPAVVSESFALILLTAVMMKLVLEVVVWAKKRFLSRLASDQLAFKVVGAIALVLILPGSKFLVLELTAFLFKGSVTLGGFWSVTLLVVTLMAARWGVRKIVGD